MAAPMWKRNWSVTICPAVSVVASYFQHYLVVFLAQQLTITQNQTLILTQTVILILTLFQFKVEQFEVVFWRHVTWIAVVNPNVVIVKTY